MSRNCSKVEQEVEADYLKSLYQAHKERQEMDQDKKLQLAKELINAERDEEHNIMVPVDVHVQKIIEGLDDVRKDEYLAYWTQISYERSKKRLYGEEPVVTETEIDPETPQRTGERVVYVHPTKREYRTNQKCDYLTYLDYEERKPCILCSDATEDILNSRIGSKTVGAVSGKTQYHDDECLLWVSEKDKRTENSLSVMSRNRRHRKGIRIVKSN